jgi:hypothetical protein
MYLEGRREVISSMTIVATQRVRTAFGGSGGASTQWAPNPGFGAEP